MKDTGATIAEREAVHSQIEKLNRSSVLHGAESLCKLLKYLAEHALDSPGTPLKEYQIATEVFGRPADFDSRVDSTVRVQTGRLRSKLAEYYAGEGAGDRLLIEIPKGAYSFAYHLRPPVEVSAPAPTLPPPPPTPKTRSFPVSWFVLSLAACAVMTVSAAIVLTRFMAPLPAATADPPAPALKAFWSAFANGPEAPMVVYSNAEFVGRPETGLRYFQPTLDSGKTIMDHYTGVGEVMAVHDLDQVFAGLHHAIHIKRGRLLTWDDAKTSDLIFIGSPSENLSLRELPGTQDFVFSRNPSAPRKGDLMISNRHPAASEQGAYFASDPPPITEDYAMIALTSGLNPSRRVLILAGITTFGTQAAVEFVCRPSTLDELIAQLGPTARRRVPPFEALFRVKVNGGVPVQSELLSLHTHAWSAEN
jgi:hypothetical protein